MSQDKFLCVVCEQEIPTRLDDGRYSYAHYGLAIYVNSKFKAICLVCANGIRNMLGKI